MSTAIVILSIIALAQLALIYGLVNRLVVQAGQRAMTPLSLEDFAKLGIPSERNAKVAHPRTPAGSVRVIS